MDGWRGELAGVGGDVRLERLRLAPPPHIPRDFPMAEAHLFPLAYRNMCHFFSGLLYRHPVRRVRKGGQEGGEKVGLILAAYGCIWLSVLCLLCALCCVCVCVLCVLGCVGVCVRACVCVCVRFRACGFVSRAHT